MLKLWIFGAADSISNTFTYICITAVIVFVRIVYTYYNWIRTILFSEQITYEYDSWTKFLKMIKVVKERKLEFPVPPK